MPVIAIQLAQLCLLDQIKSADMIQTILERVSEDTNLETIKPLVLNQPEAAIGQLLFHVVQQDSRAKFSFDFLSFLISEEANKIM